MKKIFFLITFFILYLNGFNQNQKWEVYLGVSNRIDYVSDLIETYDNGYFLVGGFEYEKGWNTKTDINGNVLWDKVFEYTYPMYGSTASIDENGNHYYCGTLWVNETISWPSITKLDSCGNKQWCKIIVDNLYMYGGSRDLLINEEGELVLLARFESTEKINQIFLIGFDVNGNILWTNPYASKKNYPGIGLASPRKLSKFNDIYIITGYCYWPFPDNPNHKYLRPFFIGIDSLFNEKWILPFAVMDSVYGEAYSVIAVNDSIYMGIGERLLEGYNMNSLLMFFNNYGQEFGYNQIPNEAINPNIDFNVIGDIERINDSLFLTTSFLGIGMETYFGEFVLDTTGKIHNLAIRDIYIGMSTLIKTFDNKFVIEVEIAENKGDYDILLYKIDENLESVPFDTNQYTYDSLCPNQIQSSTIDLSDCLIWTDIGETPTPEEYYAKLKTIPIKVFPNPAKENITFGFENTKNHKNMQLECFDVFGHNVHKEKIYNRQLEAEINISLWNEGLFVAIIISEGKVLGKVKFVVLK